LLPTGRDNSEIKFTFYSKITHPGVRVNFLPGSWCSTVFWIWDENNVNNILMFSVARLSKIFQLLTLAWAAQVHGEVGGDTAGTGIFHTVSCHAQYVSWGSWLGAAIAAWGGPGCCSSGGKQLHLCIPCFVHIIVFTFSHSPLHPTEG